ncbi:hypothetical protein VCR4J2_10001 [Vibrio coralliirubri]|nr:hypothetical protein VCR4J2_10001 [Vibrio coralliirubri]
MPCLHQTEILGKGASRLYLYTTLFDPLIGVKLELIKQVLNGFVA